jgi:hypothetical protein
MRPKLSPPAAPQSDVTRWYHQGTWSSAHRPAERLLPHDRAARGFDQAGGASAISSVAMSGATGKFGGR